MKNNYVRAAQIQNGRRQARLNAWFNSQSIGFIRLIRKILLCDARRIFPSTCFTHCGACH
ncbi:hypothetical protein DUQ00_16580 [Salmonella bongori]|uniref:Uncharacterized protein n=4 Tax=Salmonella TaxID=590 RepID=A0A750KM34_SALER|nr:hypothetical protein LFZ56_13950 [Salmonella bongori serovar 66:z41:- str. SA19983605]ECC8734040.1 hypothetical protein [Salmonella bongori]ECG8257235.1 hypothetical protein [Salmonella bongori serovar 48:i:-]EGE4655266.1 hypothetical protein [Salmonella bongori serovar 40:z35:- str. 95-0123]EGE4659843.1 hypothetical protein [Salmonella bongori serovar 48:i:- str. 94-0708]EGS1131192.1 hypothetical protein [Salmonella bongori CFSAN000509]TNB50533.1 hypothetical protein FGW25_18780 [Salmonel